MTNEPIAYAAVAADGSESVYVAILKEQAEACCRENGWFLVPLYAAPPTWQEEVATVEDAFERSGVKPTWPDDEPGNIGPMAAAMADEIDRLRLAVAEKNAIRLGELAYPGLRITDKGRWVDVWATLRGLVERQNRIVCDTKMDATLGEGTVRDDGSVSSSRTEGGQ